MTTTNEHTERAELIRRLNSAWPEVALRAAKEAAAMLEAQPAEQENWAAGYASGWRDAMSAAERICDQWGVKSSILGRELRNTTPPAQPAREWVGLTDEERDTIYHNNEPYADLRAVETLLREKNAGQPAADDKLMTPDQINEVNESLWAELDEIKDKTGYNTYRETNRGVGHWTLLGYLLNLKHRADDASDNAPWLTEAHILCTDHGIPMGHITERIRALREKLAADDKAGGEPLFYVRFLSSGMYEGPIHRNVRHYFDGEWTPLYTHPQPQTEVRVPDGYVPVPVEPTLEMGWAYLDAANACSPDKEHSFNHAGYRAMLSAAQKPQDDLPAILKKQAS